MKPSSNSSHKKDDRKPADKPNGVSQNTQRVDEKLTLGNDELVCVVEDYFAIDKVVGWRGEGRAREYRIRWKGQTPATDDWLKPSDLCKETLMEAHALVREDKRRQERLEKGIQEKASGVKPQQIVAATVTKKKVSPKPETSNKNSIVKSSQTNHPSVKPSQTNHHGVKQSQTKCPSVKPSKTNHPSVKPSKTNTVKPSHAKSLMVNKPSPPEVQDLTLDESDSGDGWSVVSNRPPEEIHKVVAKRKAPSKESCIDLTKQGANQNDKLLTLSASVNRRVDKEPLKKKRRRKRSKQKIDPVIDPEEWKRRELARGNDVGVVDFQPVERIDVTDSSAKKRVSEARINGIPIVLTGYLGWPQFATRWIKGSSEDDKVDFSKGVKLDIEKMVDDIGKEEVPIVEKNYDESNPAGNVMKASVFLNNFWPKEGENESTKKKLYLQQWQFSSSERASKILCGPDKCGPPPPSAFYEDLLPFWLSEGGNPYQYLFMGDAGTMSKLHKDPGGLEILIAPIIGQKECILCHRDDGPDYLYNLQSKLDTIDLIRFPMTAFARVWKTVVKPGEILVMPHDTYHQCRNLTPCLSYHR